MSRNLLRYISRRLLRRQEFQLFLHRLGESRNCLLRFLVNRIPHNCVFEEIKHVTDLNSKHFNYPDTN